MYHRIAESPHLGALSGLRLAVSGSAPLPADLHAAVREGSGQVVLERYGMTETAMLVSNPFDGQRRPGTVGFPLPGVELRLAPRGGGTAEIDSEPAWKPLDAVYFGGGTPTIIEPSLLAQVLESLDKRFGLAPDAEISLEANPEDWTLAKALAQEMERRIPKIATSEYRKTKRPHGTVNVDYNQNAWGRTLSSIYSVRPVPRACVSMPMTWEELEEGKLKLDDFRIDNAVDRLKDVGDLWKPVLGKKRVNLQPAVDALKPKKVSRRSSS